MNPQVQGPGSDAGSKVRGLRPQIQGPGVTGPDDQDQRTTTHYLVIVWS